MSKISFSKPGGPESMVQEAPAAPVDNNPNQLPAVVPEAGVPAVAQPGFFNDDSLDPSDLSVPRLNIVQKVGELSNTYDPGAILLGGQLILRDAPKGKEVGKPIRFLIVGFQPTVFVERVEGGLRGNMLRSEADVVAKGGTLDWNESKQTGKTWYQRSATALIAIEQVEGLGNEHFPNTFDGKRYALALYTMKGTGYNQAAKRIKSERKIGFLREHGYRGGFWTLSSKLETNKQNSYYVPVVNPAGVTSEAFRTELRDLLGF